MRSAACLTGLLLGLSLLSRSAFAGEAPQQGPQSTFQTFLQQYAYYPVQCEDNAYEPFMLKGTLNGERITFLVDTGAPGCLVDVRRAQGLKTLKELHTKISDPTVGVIDDPTLVMVPSLTISLARFVNQPVRVDTIDVDHVQPPWSALLGVDFLRRNFCIIDCGRQTIYFRGSKPTPEQANSIAESLRRSGFTAVPFRGSRRIVISSKINGKPIDWIVDTGADFTMLSEATRKELKVPLVHADTAATGTPTMLAGQFGGLNKLGLGTQPAKAIELEELAVGDRRWEGVYITSSEAVLHGGEAATREVKGLFGADLLIGHGAVIDFSSNTIWLPPQPR